MSHDSCFRTRSPEDPGFFWLRSRIGFRPKYSLALCAVGSGFAINCEHFGLFPKINVWIRQYFDMAHRTTSPSSHYVTTMPRRRQFQASHVCHRGATSSITVMHNVTTVPRQHTVTVCHPASLSHVCHDGVIIVIIIVSIYYIN